MNDDLILLASAYLDGDVTADERALVEADPELLAEVGRLRAVRMLVGDVEPPAISVREAHLAAALGAWDRLPETERAGARRDLTPSGIDAAAVAGAAAVTAPTPLRERRRAGASARSNRWLVGAAAALVLVLAGGVALQLASNDDEPTVQDAATTQEAAAELVAPAAETPDEAGAAVAADASRDAVTESSELDTGISNAAPPGEDAGLVRLETPADLADFAAAAVGAPVAPDVPAATSAPTDEDLSPAESVLAATELPVCLGVDVIVGPAVYGDVPVVVGLDEGRNLALAYRPATCAEVARARLP